MLSVLDKIKYLAIAVAWIVSLVFVYQYSADKENKKLVLYKAQIEKNAQDKDEAHKAAVVKIQKDKEDAIRTLNKRHASIVAGLQQRPQRPASAPEPSKESNPAPISTGTGSTGEQLYRQDAEFLIGEAAKADILRQALISCRKQLEQ